MPVGRGGADFTLTDETALQLDCVAGPTPPRESMVMAEGSQKGGETTGALLWKLISLLQFHQMGLDERGDGDAASALRELMMVFSEVSNASIERQIRGIVGLSSRPIVRRIQQKHGFNVARGIEVTIEFDDGAFEGQNAFLFGAVLSRFLAEYASLNSFTETVVSSRQRGILKRWRPQISRRALL
jgi:type VI secretion system protein ImpG